MNQENLFSEFKKPTYQEWYDECVKLLKGAPFDKKMNTSTVEGINLKPIYMQEDLPANVEMPAQGTYLRGTNAGGYRTKPWVISQDMYAKTPQEFNAKILDALNKGQTGVEITFDDASSKCIDADLANEIGTGGVSISTKEDMEIALKDVSREHININIFAGMAYCSAAAFLYSSTSDLSKLTGGIYADILSMLAKDGAVETSLENAYDALYALADFNAKNAPKFGAVGVDMYAYSCSGASAVEELSFAIATAKKYLSELLKRGMDINEAAPLFRFRMGVGSNFFMEIAKLRALRVLWAKVVEAFGGNEEAQKIKVFVRTTTFNKTAFDPYVNMLRTTTEAFSAIVGICDGITIGTFDEIFDKADDFSMRIARNQQILLAQECNLCDVIDPVGGSWYVENLANEIAEKSWAKFQDIESQGGMESYILEGKAAADVQNTYLARKKLYDSRRNIIVGTNSYANLTEVLLEKPEVDQKALKEVRVNDLKEARKIDSFTVDAKFDANLISQLISAVTAGASLEVVSDNVNVTGEHTSAKASLLMKRASEHFEDLRLASEASKEATGSAPKIFLATMGSLVQHKARADFIRGFFEVGGFDVIYPAGFESAEDAAKAFAESEATIAVICSTDATYPELVPSVSKAIKAIAPNAKVFMAGMPDKDLVEGYKAAGMDDSISLRTNNYDMLSSLLSGLGVI
ncbi:MAG: methylmalonyl-CoA mutase family protein [Opitutales bacterium]